MSVFPVDLKPVVSALGEEQCWLVGGAVRAYIEQQDWPTDIDMCTSLTPEVVKTALYELNLNVDTSAIKFGCIKTNINDYKVEITTLREDIYRGNNGTSEVRFTDDLEVDSQRRDFTLNALYLTSAGTLIDFHAGQIDLKNKVVRFIGDTAERLAEDPLRLIRYARFCLQYSRAGHTPELDNICLAAQPLLQRSATNRMHRELAKLPEHITDDDRLWLNHILGEDTARQRYGN